MSTFVAQNWGNVASVVGLAVSIWVLVVAQKAKSAAEESRSLARLKSLVEILTEASSRVQQVGNCLAGQQWDLTRMLTAEIAGACRLIMERWGDNLTLSSRGNLLEVSRIAKSLAVVTGQGNMRQLSKAERRQALDSQLAANDLINAILGEARRIEERR